MTVSRRDVVKHVLAGGVPDYVPWSYRFTREAADKLITHYGHIDLLGATGGHIVELGSDVGLFEDLGSGRVRDVFGVEWDRSIDKDIGIVANQLLPEPTLAGYELPDPLDPRRFADIPAKLDRYGDRYRLFCIDFSLFERAWTLRGMERLLMDIYDHPRFVADLFDAIAAYNLAQVREALRYDIDAVYFGDDWGQQHGLIMGYDWWKRHIAPSLRRMYRVVREAGKAVFIHSCGDVDELFDDLIDLGVQCFNPFQPEVMDVAALHARYHERLSFWGGLSTQRTLPHAAVADVRDETRRLIAMGRAGGYILSPAHAVEGDVPLENMLAFIDEARSQAKSPRG